MAIRLSSLSKRCNSAASILQVCHLLLFFLVARGAQGFLACV